MINIGIYGGENSDTTPGQPKEAWMNKMLKKHYNKSKQGYLFEPALAKAMEHKYKDVKVTYYENDIKESQLEKNDINFLVGINLLNFWEKGKAEYNRVLKLMENPKYNVYPNLKEQFFLYNKGDYLEYFKKKGIPIAPTFIVRDDRNINKIIERVKEEGWKSFVLNPYFAYANIGIGKFDVDDKNMEKEVSKYLSKHKKFPAFVCQEVMNGFAKFWEVKSFWLNGKFKYYIAMKACEEVFSESKIFESCPTKYGTVTPQILKLVKQMGKKVVDAYPESYVNGKRTYPLFLRIDFGCCLGNTLDGKSYFLNEVEYAGCGVFTEDNTIFKHWPTAYYKKAKELVKGQNKPKKNKKTMRVRGKKNKKNKKTRRVKK